MNMAQETNPGQAPMLCSTGCGFYGNPRTNGMCSLCYKEHLQRQNGSSGRISPPTSPVVNLPEPSQVSSSDDTVQESQSTETQTSAPVQPTPLSSQSAVSEPEASSQVENTSDDKIATETEDLQDISDPSRHTQTGLICDTRIESEVAAGNTSQEDIMRRGKRKRQTDFKLESAAASASESAQNSSEELEKSPDKPKMKKKNRCFMCRKKVGLTGFECRCGNVFCGTHRYSDVHSCSYDYKADAAEKIRKENPVVVGEKVQKI
ncbi:AN1-type zinc finger protein 6 isoform X1 [Ambystoma mexicanum]|uniref:AN1-type zinc finger protein 6 isoform X1 n=1 Tax=Ambystoma mexicanum TaxID=8296 RepID=UPI0037E8B0A1